MEIKNISLHELRKMNDSEGLVIQGCGGDLQEWADGINEMLTERGILQNESRFEKAYTFNNEKLTCLLFPFDGVQLDIGKLAMWRLERSETFGSTWLTDYVDNRLNGFVKEMTKPKCPLIGQDGNISLLWELLPEHLRKTAWQNRLRKCADVLPPPAAMKKR